MPFPDALSDQKVMSSVTKLSLLGPSIKAINSGTGFLPSSTVWQFKEVLNWTGRHLHSSVDSLSAHVLCRVRILSQGLVQRLDHNIDLFFLFRWWLVQMPPLLTWQRSSRALSLSNKHLWMVRGRERLAECLKRPPGIRNAFWQTACFKDFGTSPQSKQNCSANWSPLNVECDTNSASQKNTG